MQNLPKAVLDACAANLRKVAEKHGRTTQQIIRSTNPNKDSPDKSCNIFNVLAIGKKTLGLPLTSAEIAFLAANGFVSHVNGGGLESYIESVEADAWPELRRLLAVSAPQHLEHFDNVIGILGSPFSTDQQVRTEQWQDKMEALAGTLQELETQFYNQEYPSLAEIEKFMFSEDVVLISDEDLRK